MNEKRQIIVTRCVAVHISDHIHKGNLNSHDFLHFPPFVNNLCSPKNAVTRAQRPESPRNSLANTGLRYLGMCLYGLKVPRGAMDGRRGTFTSVARNIINANRITLLGLDLLCRKT